ncbi:MAG TPA: radical SAM family heme chaperone HemW [Actinomycetota bacterium]|nr:radical SAM family heme chaperone HemW [Actinomycetota bacterium]
MNLPAAPALSGRGVYVHIPFCLVHCPYCDFNAYAGMDDLKAPYVEALRREIEAAADGEPVDTVAFGGGTPTELAPADLASILTTIRESFAVRRNAEISLEANPESIDMAAFDALLEAGFTRVSLGVQSLAPHVLAWLGRAHSPEQAVAALRDARAAGFAHVNADLMFGTPVETLDDWRSSLTGVIATGVDHVSTYALTVEERTPLHTWVQRGLRDAPDDDDQADRDEVSNDLLPVAGLLRYEVSNWARPGCWSRHNIGYWTGTDYLGFGAGAHSFRDHRRWWNLRSPRTYAQRSPDVLEGEETLLPDERSAEAMMLGLRLAGGVIRARFEHRYGADPALRWAPELAQAVDLGLVRVTEEKVLLTARGVFLWGHVARSLLAA